MLRTVHATTCRTFSIVMLSMTHRITTLSVVVKIWLYVEHKYTLECRNVTVMMSVKLQNNFAECAYAEYVTQYNKQMLSTAPRITTLSFAGSIYNIIVHLSAAI